MKTHRSTYTVIDLELEEGEYWALPIANSATPLVDLPEEAAYPALARMVQDGLLTENEMLLLLTGRSI